MKNPRQREIIPCRIYWTITSLRSPLMDVSVIDVKPIKENSLNIDWRNYPGKRSMLAEGMTWFVWRILIFYLKRWHITKNAQGELQSVSKEDHPVDCPLTINVQPFCSSNTLQPAMIDYVEELPNLKELLKQRELHLEEIEAKRAKLDLNQSGNTVNRIENCHSSLDVISRKSTKMNISLPHMVIIDFLLWSIIMADRVMLVRIKSSSSIDAIDVLSPLPSRTLYINCLRCERWCLVDIWWYISNILYRRTCSNKSSSRCLRCDVHASVCIRLFMIIIIIVSFVL